MHKSNQTEPNRIEPNQHNILLLVSNFQLKLNCSKLIYCVRLEHVLHSQSIRLTQVNVRSFIEFIFLFSGLFSKPTRRRRTKNSFNDSFITWNWKIADCLLFIASLTFFFSRRFLYFIIQWFSPPHAAGWPAIWYNQTISYVACNRTQHGSDKGNQNISKTEFSNRRRFRDEMSYCQRQQFEKQNSLNGLNLIHFEMHREHHFNK